MAHRLALAGAFLNCLLLAACGGDKPTRPQVANPGQVRARSAHDYSTTWVYAVGEIDSPTKADCIKALGFLEGEATCVGRACQRATQLLKDTEFACVKLLSAEERSRVKLIGPGLRERAGQASTHCLEQIESLITQGCGENGACEPKAQRWATQCSAVTQSNLLVHLLERQIENSLLEPHRVKLDTRSCDDFAKAVDEAGSCGKPFDCEDALPKVEAYVSRCAQGKRKALPLAQALSILRIQLGAERPILPIAVVGDKTKIPPLPGTLPLADGTGVVYRVCDESPGDLSSYLTQRAACKDGSLLLWRTLPSATGVTLNLVTAPHDHDLAFQLAYPRLWVQGEVELRTEQRLKAFAAAAKSLPVKAMDDFSVAIAALNRAFADLPSKLRQSEQVAQALTPNDEALVPLFALIGDSKVRVAGTRLDDAGLLALLHRAEVLVFSDMTTKGNIELNASLDLSELLTREALPKAFAAYDKKLDKLRALVKKRKLNNYVELDDTSALAKEHTKDCATARKKLVELQATAEPCLQNATTCNADKRGELSRALEAGLSEWHAARVREITAKASAAKPIVPSKDCDGP